MKCEINGKSGHNRSQHDLLLRHVVRICHIFIVYAPFFGEHFHECQNLRSLFLFVVGAYGNLKCVAFNTTFYICHGVILFILKTDLIEIEAYSVFVSLTSASLFDFGYGFCSKNGVENKFIECGCMSRHWIGYFY